MVKVLTGEPWFREQQKQPSRAKWFTCTCLKVSVRLAAVKDERQSERKNIQLLAVVKARLKFYLHIQSKLMTLEFALHLAKPSPLVKQFLGMC